MNPYHPLANTGLWQRPIYDGAKTRNNAYRELVLERGFVIRHERDYRKGIDCTMKNPVVPYNRNEWFKMQSARQAERDRHDTYLRKRRIPDHFMALRSEEVPYRLPFARPRVPRRNRAQEMGEVRTDRLITQNGMERGIKYLQHYISTGGSHKREFEEAYNTLIKRRQTPDGPLNLNRPIVREHRNPNNTEVARFADRINEGTVRDYNTHITANRQLADSFDRSSEIRSIRRMKVPRGNDRGRYNIPYGRYRRSKLNFTNRKQFIPRGSPIVQIPSERRIGTEHINYLPTTGPHRFIPPNRINQLAGNLDNFVSVSNIYRGRFGNRKT